MTTKTTHTPATPEYMDQAVDRFFAKVILPEDAENDKATCWYWQGAKHGQNRGYGKFSWLGKTISAHQASYVLFVGEIPEGKVVGHQCNCESCVNPHHLKAETQKENIQYCVASGRHASRQK